MRRLVEASEARPLRIASGRPSRWTIGALLVGASALASPGARAQQPQPSPQPSAREATASDIAAARELGTEGVKLAQDGKCTEAIDYLTRATKLYGAPSLLVPLGECLVSQGRLVEGSESYNRALRDTLPANAPKAFTDAQQKARTLLAATLPRIARLQILVEPDGINPTVTVDQEPVSSVLIGAYRPTDPGTRMVEATARGYKKATATVKLAEGQRDTVKLKLEFDPTAPPIPADPVNQTELNPAKEIVVPPLPGEGQEAPKPYDPLRTTGFFALGVGIIGLGVGTGFAIAAGSHDNDQAATDRDRTVSTVSFIASGVLTATGIILLIVTASSDQKPAKAALRRTPASAPDWAAVRGAF